MIRYRPLASSLANPQPSMTTEGLARSVAFRMFHCSSGNYNGAAQRTCKFRVAGVDQGTTRPTKMVRPGSAVIELRPSSCQPMPFMPKKSRNRSSTPRTRATSGEVSRGHIAEGRDAESGAGRHRGRQGVATVVEWLDCRGRPAACAGSRSSRVHQERHLRRAHSRAGRDASVARGRFSGQSRASAAMEIPGGAGQCGQAVLCRSGIARIAEMLTDLNRQGAGESRSCFMPWKTMAYG